MKTLEELERENIAHQANCWWCGSIFKRGSIWSDPNKHGISLLGKSEKQLVFLHCNDCGNDTSLTRWIS
ncbi:MAG: hypothetical protein ACW98F_09490 [Candidatus Hodarchaeales archaeon]|jgi:hypothetical protein